jgi:hypothetical protein
LKQNVGIDHAVAILLCAVVLACLSATARADTTHKEINDFVKALSFSDFKAMKMIPKTAPSCRSSQCTLTPSPLPQPQRNVDSCLGLASKLRRWL